MTNNISIFAHRGASATALENSFTAFEKAKKQGADGIELDVQCTKDHVLVVFHDLDLYRLTGLRKKINECNFDEIKNCPIGKSFLRKMSKHRIPTLKEVVDWANKSNISLNIELKESLIDNPKPLIDFLHDVILPNGSHFSSFHEKLIRIVKMQRPDMETAFLITKKFNWNEIHTYTNYDTIHAHKKYYKPNNLEALKLANKKIRFYGLNGKETYLQSPDESVIGWITDYPDRLRKIENNRIKKQTFKD